MNINWAPIVAGLMVVAGLAGLVTGIIPHTDALTILTIGLGVFGIHTSNVQLGNKLGGK